MLVNLLGNGSLGVDFFFLISGFLITYLLLTERSVSGTIGIKNFYLRRILRIWPLYFAIIAFTPLLILISDQKPPDYWWTMGFATNFLTITGVADLFPFAHYWSLCVEEHFYLLWPVLIAFVPIKRLPYCFALIILGSVAYRCYAYYTYPMRWQVYNYYHTFARVDVLAIGSWIGYLHFQKPLVINISRWVRLFVYTAFLGLLVAGTSHAQDSVWAAAGRKYIYTFFFLFGVLNYLFNPDSFLNFKKKNFIHYLGKISFGLYLIHNLLYPFISIKLMRRWGCTNVFVFLLIYIVILLVLSIASYELFEKYFLKLKSRFAVVKTNY
jgi:peptidoglycan/LPS O-acetylase OafA/YrhL